MRRLLLVIALLTVPRLAFAQVPETIEYYAQDAIGSIRVVFTPTGAVVARQDYAPFGRPLFPAPAMPKEGFGGNEKDDESDQAYFHARMFQARTGRFTSVDSIYNGLLDPQGWNRYAYAWNTPINATDFGGLDPKDAAHSRSGCIEFATFAEYATCRIEELLRGPLTATTFGWGPTLVGQGGRNRGAGAGRGGGGSAGGSTTSGDTTTTSNGDVDATSAGGNADCPSVPPGPLTANLQSNILEARIASAALRDATLPWFYDKVRNARGRTAEVARNQSWDYKQLGHQYEDFTNFNYGATGQAAGIPYATIAGASAVAHVQAHRLDAFMPSGLTNEAHDQFIIAQGFSYARNGCR